MDKYLKKNENDNVQQNGMQIEDSPPRSSNNRKRKLPNYNKSWEEHPLFKDWIRKSENNYAYCMLCNSEIKAIAGISDLKVHVLTSKHQARSKAVQLYSGSDLSYNEMWKCNAKVSNIELHLAAFCAEHNIALLAMDHLVPLLQTVVEDSDLLKKTKCARTKTTAIIKNVIGETHHEELCSVLKSNKFSLCADESTDISTTKLLSLVVRVEFKGKICDFFFDLVKVTDCTANGIYKSIADVFNKYDISYKTNLIGFAADGANVMTGGNHSVATLLKQDCPNLIIFKCICHSFALCANSACSALPKFVEGGARDIYNFIQNSPKRVDLFTELQVLLDYNPRKMLHPSQTRWLSLEATVKQLLSRMEVLKLFFLHEDLENFDSVQRIRSYLQNPEFELYLLFLKFILNDVNKLNCLFQSESPQIHILYSEISRLYRKIFEYVVKEDYKCFETFKTIDFNNGTYIKDPNDIYLGAEVSLALNTTHKLSTDKEYDFRTNCLKFYVQLCNSLLKKFDFENDFLKCVEILAPANVMKGKVKSIYKLCAFVPNVVPLTNIQEVDDEWRELIHLNFENINLLEERNIQKFWEVIFQIKRGNQTEAFPHLKTLVYAILSVPVATANVERVFSQININKNKRRNKLEIPTLCGILRTKDFLKKSNNNCTNFMQSKQMEMKFKKEMYK